MEDSTNIQATSPVPPSSHNTPLDMMNFYAALKQIVAGYNVTKLEWQNRNIYGFMKDELLMLHKEDGKNYQWVLSLGDISGEDWVVL